MRVVVLVARVEDPRAADPRSVEFGLDLTPGAGCAIFPETAIELPTLSEFTSLSIGVSAAARNRLGAVESWVPASAGMAKFPQNAVLSHRIMV
jgi:hypothetical protein